MSILAIDIGSAAAKAAIVEEGAVRGGIARRGFVTRFEGSRAEASPQAILKALAGAIAELGAAARRVDYIALANMAPSWVAMDQSGEAITPVVTHQDRRSVQEARELEERVGKQQILHIAGCRPFPGGISSTTCAWFVRHEKGIMRRAGLVGHLNTFIHRQMTGSRVTDPSNASFMGLYSTLKLSGWNEELIEAVGVRRELLPQVVESDVVAGFVLPAAARRFSPTMGTPVLAGCMDGSAAMLLAGARPGQLMDVSGSTDVSALCTDKSRPHEKLLTRALGIGRMWMSVSTIAAAGSALMWIKQQLFREMSLEEYWRVVGKLAGNPRPSSVRFENYLAGDRMSIEQRQGAFAGLTLSSTREEMLGAVIESLAAASAQRLPLLEGGGRRIRRSVMASGGVGAGLSRILHRDWPGKWSFVAEEEATIRGLGTMRAR